jgi:flagellar motor protein MotB
MKPKYYEAGHNHGHRDWWMVTYMDVLTILLILFVATAAQALKRARQSPEPAAPEPRHAQLLAAQHQLEHLSLDARIEPRGIVIRLPQAILFAPGDDRVSPDALPVVEQIGAVLREIPNQVTVAGYADATPIRNRRFRNNWELAAARGFTLLNLLTSHCGLAEERLSVASYGSRDPKAPNTSAEGRASNRRAEIVILE